MMSGMQTPGHVDLGLQSGPAVPADSDFSLRALCFALCLPSGLALMAKVFGVAEVRTFTFTICLPCTVALVVIGVRARRDQPRLATDLAIGAVAGLIATLAYDLVRIPALIAGYRIYGTISVFGLWLLDAPRSSRFSEVAGWGYNYFNGICFGIMYALFMRGRHWGFAVLWAFILETVAVATPFGRIFGVRSNLPVLLIAYAAHVAYGVPLGRAVQNWRDTRLALAEMPLVVRATLAATAILLLFHSFLIPGVAAKEPRPALGEFRVEGTDLNPDWIRIRRGQAVEISNPGETTVAVVLKERDLHMALAPRESAPVTFPRPGIFQLFVETHDRTHSSFVLVEPVEENR
jgi:hypothetical protein